MLSDIKHVTFYCTWNGKKTYSRGPNQGQVFYSEYMSTCLSWQKTHSHSATVDISYYAPVVGLIDAVFTTLLLHITPHLYHLSSAEQQEFWPFSQTIRTADITTHDRHKLSTAPRHTACRHLPGALPGWCLRQEKLLTSSRDVNRVTA